jgi:hypothetical protein
MACYGMGLMETCAQIQAGNADLGLFYTAMRESFCFLITLFGHAGPRPDMLEQGPACPTIAIVIIFLYRKKVLIRVTTTRGII